MKSGDTGCIGLVVVLGLWAAFWITVIWVVCHFIAKFW